MSIEKSDELREKIARVVLKVMDGTYGEAADQAKELNRSDWREAVAVADALLPLLSDKGWQPIENIPDEMKDGRYFLGSDGGEPVYCMYQGDRIVAFDWRRQGYPTHWRPLPLPPLPLKEST